MLSARQREIIEENVAEYDLAFARCRERCANPSCGYPLKPLEDYQFVLGFGKVCLLCHQMYFAVRACKGLVAAHEDWDKDQKSKAKMLDNDNYLKGGNA